MQTSMRTTTNNNIIHSQPQRKMTDEGAIRLASAILSSTCRDYIACLEEIRNLRHKPKKSKAEYLKLEKAFKTKTECEIFYKSNWFVTLTLGRSKPGQEVIKDIQKMANYVEEE